MEASILWLKDRAASCPMTWGLILKGVKQGRIFWLSDVLRCILLPSFSSIIGRDSRYDTTWKDEAQCSARYARTLGNRPKSDVSTLCSSAFPRLWCASSKTDLVIFSPLFFIRVGSHQATSLGINPKCFEFFLLVLPHAVDNAIHVLPRS